MLDAEPGRITKTGIVEVTTDRGININGFEAEGCTCRDVAALAMTWAIQQLSDELQKVLERPGQSTAVVD